MPTPRQRRVVRRHAGVTLCALLVLAVTGALTLDVALVASLLSLLVGVVLCSASLRGKARRVARGLA